MSTEIIEGNKLIAEFMGYTEYNDTGAFVKGDSLRLVLSYQDNWSELMPVVDYIDTFHERTNGAVYCQSYATSHTFYIHFNSGKVINERYPKYKEGRHRGEHNSRIYNVWAAVVEFIKWYQNQILNNTIN